MIGPQPRWRRASLGRGGGRSTSTGELSGRARRCRCRAADGADAAGRPTRPLLAAGGGASIVELKRHPAARLRFAGGIRAIFRGRRCGRHLAVRGAGLSSNLDGRRCAERRGPRTRRSAGSCCARARSAMRSRCWWGETLRAFPRLRVRSTVHAVLCRRPGNRGAPPTAAPPPRL